MIDSTLKEKSSNVRGLTTSWIEAGTVGSPVIMFLHGFPDDATVWRAQIESLSVDYHVIAPNVRGCASSAPAEELHRYGREAVLLDHLTILSQVVPDHVPVICVGHDLGVVHAMTLARRLGPRCAGLVCINGLDLEMFARRLRTPAQIIKSWYMGFMQVPALPEMVAKIAPRTANWLAQTLAGGNLEAPNDVMNSERRTIAPLNQYRAFAREVGRTDAETGRIKCPVLVIWGRDDGVLLPPTEDEWRRVALDPLIRIIPGGHWLHRDQHDVINHFIGGFAQNSLRVGAQ